MPANFPTGGELLGIGVLGEKHSRMHGRVLQLTENALAFGAVGDGIVDDRAALQEGIDTLSAAGGGNLFIPPGYEFSVGQHPDVANLCLELKSNVVILGAGFASVIRARPNLNDETWIIGNLENQWGMGLKNFRLDGNRSNQPNDVGGATFFVNAEFQQGPIIGEESAIPSGSGWGNMSYVDKMLFIHCTSTGFAITGSAAEMHVSNSMAFNCGVGFNLANGGDSHGTQLTAGVIDREGFIVSGSSRLTCAKAYVCGQEDDTVGAFRFGDYVEASSIEAQEHPCNGIIFDGHNCVVQGVIEAINGAALIFRDEATNNIVDISYGNGPALPTGVYTLTRGIVYEGGAVDNKTRFTTLDDPTDRWVSGGSKTDNETSINRQHGAHAQQTSATITPNPYDGESKLIILTSNVTVANPSPIAHPGTRLRFVFSQDLTGGRTVTWGDKYVVNWTPDTTADQKNNISFVFDGGVWVQEHYQTLPHTWAPDDYPDLVLWLNADEIVAADNDPLTTWADDSTVGNDVTQADASKKPTYKINRINTLPAVSFDGGDYLSTALLTPQNGPWTAFFIANATNAADNRILMGPANNLTEAAMYLKDTTGAVAMFADAEITAGGDKTGAFHCFTFVMDRAHSTCSVDGTATLSGDPGDDVFSGYRIGANQVNEHWLGDIAEVLVYETNLTTDQTKRVHEYLADKYALVIA